MRPLTGLRLGWVREHFGQGLDGEVEKAVRAALDVYKSLGATLHPVSLPHSKYAVATYYVIAPSEASSNLARYDGVHYGYRTDEKEMLLLLVRRGRRRPPLFLLPGDGRALLAWAFRALGVRRAMVAREPVVRAQAGRNGGPRGDARRVAG